MNGAQIEIRSEVIALKQKYGNQIKAGITGDAAAGYIAKMNELLREWNPTGASVDELVHLLGEPSKRSENEVVFFFDTGLGGRAWRFKTENKKVVGWEEIPLF